MSCSVVVFGVTRMWDGQGATASFRVNANTEEFFRQDVPRARKATASFRVNAITEDFFREGVPRARNTVVSMPLKTDHLYSKSLFRV